MASSKPAKPPPPPGAGGGREGEATKTKEALLLSTIAHLIGLKEGKNGRLELEVEEVSLEGSSQSQGRGGTGGRSGRGSVLNIENLSTERAQQWRPGALLETVAELGILSPAEIAKSREKLNIRKGPSNGNPPPPPVNRAVSVSASGPGVNSSAGARPVGNPRANYKHQPPADVDSPPPKSGFLPPRRHPVANPPARSVINGSGTQDNSEPFQKRQFTFRPANQGQGSDPGYVNPNSTSNVTRGNFGGGKPNAPTSLYGVPTSNKQPTKPVICGRAEEQPRDVPMFRTAMDIMMIEDKKKGITRNYNTNPGSSANVSGLRRPARTDSNVGRVARAANNDNEDKPISDNPEVEEIMQHESMKNVDPKMVEAVLNEVMQIAETAWDDIAGLENVKTTIQEIIILPMLRPDLFTGIRSPAKGILFFGPPGTGKTMFGRLIATQSKSTFFNISASSLTSKWIGDGEKMVRALFAVARVKQPSVIFIDEIDSILTQRSDTEHESSRRLKTEFLIQFDGAATQNEDRILVIGVTNRPQELDEAARRRLVKRIYIPLPDLIGRKQIVKNLTKELSSILQEKDYDSIAEIAAGYSGADMNSLCKEAALGPLRDVPRDALADIHASQVRSIQMKDFVSAQKVVKSSVAESDVLLYEEWNSKFGCHS